MFDSKSSDSRAIADDSNPASSVQANTAAPIEAADCEGQEPKRMKKGRYAIPFACVAMRTACGVLC